MCKVTTCDVAVNRKEIAACLTAYAATRGPESQTIRLALADSLEEAGACDLAAQVRQEITLETVCAILDLLGLKDGRKRYSSVLKASLRTVTSAVYAARQKRAQHPEGKFDKQGRWYPSGREDADSYTSHLRSPSAAWPYSYVLGCRTKAHCANLVHLYVLGWDVPADVSSRAGQVRSDFLARLAQV